MRSRGTRRSVLHVAQRGFTARTWATDSGHDDDSAWRTDDLPGPGQYVLLALAGLIIAVVAALGPAGWAARTRTAFALRAE